MTAWTTPGAVSNGVADPDKYNAEAKDNLLHLKEHVDALEVVVTRSGSNATFASSAAGGDATLSGHDDAVVAGGDDVFITAGDDIFLQANTSSGGNIQATGYDFSCNTTNFWRGGIKQPIFTTAEFTGQTTNGSGQLGISHGLGVAPQGFLISFMADFGTAGCEAYMASSSSSSVTITFRRTDTGALWVSQAIYASVLLYKY
jgi:hypothetical protein